MSGHSRPILARKGGSPPESSSSNSNEQSSGRAKRVLIESACAACRRRKSKCDGQRPSCTRCIYLGTECQYQTEEGESRWSALKRKNQSLEAEVGANKELHEFLQSRPEEEAQKIFHRLRNSTYESLNSILRQIKDGDLTVEPSTLTTNQSRTRLPPLRSMVDIPGYRGGQARRLPAISTSPNPQHSPVPDLSPSNSQEWPTSFIQPEYNVQAAYWTKVTGNDQLVSHLISLFFQWDHPVHNFFDKGLFLEDLVARRTTFCSQLLVNSILTAACTFSPLTQSEVEPWRNHSLHMAFHRESRRLWHLEEGKDSLTTMISAFLITYELNKMGKDKIGLSFQVHGLRMAKDLGLLRVAPMVAAARSPHGVSKAHWKRARSVAAWSAFNWQILTTFAFQSPPLLHSQPPIPIPDHAQQDQDPAAFRAYCSLAVIQNEVGAALYGSDGSLAGSSPSPEHTEILNQKLLSFHESLPHSLDVEEHRENEKLVLHMMYYSIIIRLFKPFCGAGRDASERVRSYKERANEVSKPAIRQLWRLLDIYASTYGFEVCSCYVMQILLIGAYAALDELMPSETPSAFESQEAYRFFMLCIEGLRTLGDNFYLAQPVLRTITMAIRKRPIVLTARAQEILYAYDSEEWIANAARNIHSQYAAEWRGDKDLDSIRLDNLVQEWKELAIADKGSDISDADPSSAGAYGGGAQMSQ